MPYTHKAFTITMVIMVAALIVSVGSSVTLSLYVAQRSQHEWCSVLLLINNPPRPKSQTQRADRFYKALHILEREFGCSLT